MGGGGSRAAALPTSVILTRIDECMIPEERDTLFDFIEMLDSKLLFPGALVKVSNEFKENDGVQCFFKIFKRMIKDDVCVSLIVQLFDRQKTRTPVIMDFIQFGGLDLLDKTLNEHQNNKILVSEINKLLKSVLLVGAKAAISEIDNETESLALCMNCQEAIERKKRLKSSAAVSDSKIPTPKERIKRVLTFMANYSDKPEVLQSGLEALMAFANNSDAKGSIGDTDFVHVASECIKNHGQKEEIMWRACSALPLACKFNSEIAASITRAGTHELIAEHYLSFNDEPRVQMSIMWLFDGFLGWEIGNARKRVWQSQRCLDLFFKLIQQKERLMRKAVIADVFAPYKVTLPLSIRAFMRETGGELLPEDVPPPPVLKEFRKRRNFDEMPTKTVEELFQEGDKGLVEKKKDPNAPKEWEEKLTYNKNDRTYADRGNG